MTGFELPLTHFQGNTAVEPVLSMRMASLTIVVLFQ